MSFWPFCCRTPQVHSFGLGIQQFADDGISSSYWPDVQGRPSVGESDGIERLASQWVDNEQDWISLSYGAGVRRDGTLWKFLPSPMQIGSDNGWTHAATGNDGQTVLAMKGQSLYSYGSNAFGALGIGLAPDDFTCGAGFWRARISSAVAGAGEIIGTGWTSERPSLRVEARICDTNAGGLSSRWVSQKNGSGASVSFDWLAEIESISVVAAGGGYSSPPRVTIQSSSGDADEIKANATAAVTKMTPVMVSKFLPLTPGVGYLSGQVTAVEQTTGATAVGTTDQGGVVSWSLTSSGTSPIDPMQSGQLSVTIQHSGVSLLATTAEGRDEVLVASADNLVSGQLVSGYGIQSGTIVRSIRPNTTIPEAEWVVSISKPATASGQSPLLFQGTGATARVELQASSVAEVTVLSNPMAWKSPPKIEFSGGGGGGAAAVALLRGKVSNIAITSGGSGYTQQAGAGSRVEKVLIVPDISATDRYRAAWTEQNGLVRPVAMARLSPSGVVEFAKATANYTADEFRAIEDAGSFGRYHATQRDGRVLRCQAVVDIEGPPGRLPPSNISAYLFGPGSRREPLVQFSGPVSNGQGFFRYVFVLPSDLTGYTHPPTLVVEHSPFLQQQGQPAWQHVESVVQINNQSYWSCSLVDASGNSAPPIAGSTYVAVGQSHGGSSTYRILGGKPYLLSVSHAPHQEGDVAPAPVDVSPPVPAGPWHRLDLGNDQWFFPIVGSPGQGLTGTGDAIPWLRPSINQKTFFRCPPPQAGPGTAAAGESSVPQVYGSTKTHVGVGQVSVTSPGSGYTEEPSVEAFTQFYDQPVLVPGSWQKVVGDGGVETSAFIQGSAFLAISQSGQLHWWGPYSADRTSGFFHYSEGDRSGWAGYQPFSFGTRSLAGHYTAQPTPVGRGVVFDSTTQSAAIDSVAVGGYEMEVSAPEHGGNWLYDRASFLNNSTTNPAAPLVQDDPFLANNLYGLFNIDSYCGLGYESPPTIRSVRQPAPSIGFEARLCGPSLFTDLAVGNGGNLAKGNDGRWYVVKPGQPVLPKYVRLTAFQTNSVTRSEQVAPGVSVQAVSHVRSVTGDTKDGFLVHTSLDDEGVGYTSHIFNTTGGSYRQVWQGQLPGSQILQTISPVVNGPDGVQVNPQDLPSVVVSGGGTGARARLRFAYDLGPHDDPLPMRPHCVDPVLMDNIGSRFIVSASGGGASLSSGFATRQPHLAGLTSIRADLGRKQSDGSIWDVGAMKCIGPISLEMQNYGQGYSSPATATISQPSADIASYEATFNGRVCGIAVIDGGSGYESPPPVSLAGGGGSGASAVAVIAGPVSSVEVTAQGSGYRYPPDISFSQPGLSASATAILAGDRVASVVLKDGGRYRVPPTVTFTPVKDVESIDVTLPGDGFTTAPAVIIAGGGGEDAKAECTLSAKVHSIVVTSPGEGYTSPPAVSFSGGGGTGASAECTLGKLGSVIAVDVLSAGSGYTSAPSVLFTGGGGQGAAAVCKASGFVSGVSITASGSNYTTSPSVSFVGGGGAGAAASVEVSTGSVTKISILNGGFGYTATPSVVFSGGGGGGAKASATLDMSVNSVAVSAGGSGYTSPPTVEFVGNSQVQATAAARLGFGVESVTVKNGGGGYASAPGVTFSGDGAGASAFANIKGGVGAVSVTHRGHHYSAPPKVLFVGGGGGYAEAVATLAAPGGGAAATTKINGSIICVNVTAGGTGYQSEPTATVAGKASLSSRILGSISSVSVTNGGDRYSDSGIGPDGIGGRIPSTVWVYAAPYSNPRQPRRQIGVGLVPNEVSSGGPVTAVSLDPAAASLEFYAKPIPYPANAYFVVPETVLTYVGVAVEKISNDANASAVARSDRSSLPYSDSLFSISTPRASTDSSQFGTVWTPDIVSPAGSLAIVTTTLNDSWRSSLGGYFSVSPTATVEDEAGQGAVVTLLPRANGEFISGIASESNTSPVYGSVAVVSSGGAGYTLRSKVTLSGGTPAVWSPENVAAGQPVVRDGRIESVAVTSPGFGYYRDPLVYVVGGGGSGAVVSAKIANGSVSEFLVQNGGSGYSLDAKIVVVDQEREVHRLPGYASTMSQVQEASAAWLTNWTVEHAACVHRKQRTLTGMRRVAWDSPDARMHPVFADDGYVEHISVGTFDYTLHNTHQGGTDPVVTFASTGNPEVAAAAIAKTIRWSDVYGPAPPRAFFSYAIGSTLKNEVLDVDS